MSDPHESLRDDLPAYALGTLDDAATERLKRHLATCAECRSILREYEEVMRLLPLGLPQVEPSPATRRLLFHRIRSDIPSRQPSRGGWLRQFRVPALTAAVVVAIVLLSSLVALQSEQGNDDDAIFVENLRENPDTHIISMTGSQFAPQAVAQLLFQPGKTRAGLVVSGLPPLPEDREYQLWFVDPFEARYSGGTFNVDARGKAIVAVTAPAEYAPGWSCGVTDEPAGGSDHPTGINVLRGDYTDYEW